MPAGATEVVLPAQRSAVDELRSLEPGSLVAVRDARPASWWRARSFMAQAGLRAEKEFVAVPGFDGPGFLVEADGSAFRHFFSRVLYVPGGRWLKVVAARLAAHLASTGLGWRIASAVAPARVVIARRV